MVAAGDMTLVKHCVSGSMSEPCVIIIVHVPAMGVESGGRGGRVPRSRKISGDVPPKMMILKHLFS